LKYKNKVGNPIGFDISVLNKFKRINGDIGAKYMVKRLKKDTNFINVNSNKAFKDFDLKKDFN
jgi:molybdenum cofactor cytidylyltransferase